MSKSSASTKPAVFLAFAALCWSASPFTPGLFRAASAATAPTLGVAESFAVLGASGVTNTGNTVVTGDLGVSPLATVTGFPPGTLNGDEHLADAVALQAQSDVTDAWDALTAQACDGDLTGLDLGGMMPVPGVYCFDSTAQLTGTLTLNGGTDDVWVFRIGSTLTTASGSSVAFTGGAQACNVFWQVGSSATLGSTTVFAGNILALASISLTDAASVSGRLLARTEAVTLINNNVTAGFCADSDTDLPLFELSAINPGPPASIEVSLQDTGSGLASIEVVTADNATVLIPEFTPGTTEPVIVTATKINQSRRAQVVIKVTDVAGNVLYGDPVLVDFDSGIGQTRTEVLTGVPGAENWVTVYNGSPGLRSLDVIVNGALFQMADLYDHEQRTLDVAEAMLPGSDNTIVLVNSDGLGGRAMILVSDALPKPSSFGAPFIRGDANDDAVIDLADAMSILGRLFLGDAPGNCTPASDANGDGQLNISDAGFILGYAFLGDSAPPAPFPECGVDRSPGGLDCVSFESCE